ncbi:hypothetical protein [uncultured Kingella sp.]|uniref:hypothetical protein n=1 Tax=uncultured Kingella sp. TaxID=159270 RepID=UPI00259402F8|nr:hypothetical protein [uncultured Kingella sp.]
MNGLCAGCDVGKPPTFHLGFQAAFIAPTFRQPKISIKLKTNGALAARPHCSNQQNLLNAVWRRAAAVPFSGCLKWGWA